jgi:hypothetical protein
MSIARTLRDATGLDRNANESDDAYARRLAKAVEKLSDSSWKTVAEEAQVWANSALEAMHTEKPLPHLDGVADIKAKAEPKPVVAKKQKKTDTRPIMTTGKLNRNAVIKILTRVNPHEEGTRAWWAFSYYQNGMTVQEAYNRCVGWTNIVWDHANGYIALIDTE